MKLKNVSILTMLFSAQVVLAQNAFQNLDFEQATIVPTGPEFLPYVEAAPALPGWIPYIGNTPASGIVYDTISLGSPTVSIHDSFSLLSSSVLQGNYSVIIQHSLGGNPTTAAIGQTGQLPADVVSLVFYTTPVSSLASLDQLQVTFAGGVIPLFEISRTDKYSIVGGDISAFASQSGELRFTALPTYGTFALDQIQFSTQAVPEPGTLALLGLGGLLAGLSRWQVFRRK